MIRQDFGNIQNLSYSTSGIMVSAFKLILVPVWVTDIKTHDQISRVLINGQTGTVQSEIPEGGLAGWLEPMLGSQPG